MIKNNLICRKIYYNLRKKKKQIRLNLSSTRGGRKDKNADDDADSWVDVTSDPESDQEKMEDSNDNEESKDYRVGGYHPVNIGDLYEQRYFVIRKLGWGHFSTVWLCWDKIATRFVALKIMKSAPQYTETAIDEIKLLKCVQETDPQDPNREKIVQLLDNFTISGVHGVHICMVLEVEGFNTYKLLLKSNNKGIPLYNVKCIVKQLLEALEYLHNKCNIIHTDIKPENVLLGSNNDHIFELALKTYNQVLKENLPLLHMRNIPSFIQKQLNSNSKDRKMVKYQKYVEKSLSIIVQSYSNLNRKDGEGTAKETNQIKDERNEKSAEVKEEHPREVIVQVDDLVKDNETETSEEKRPLELINNHIDENNQSKDINVLFPNVVGEDKMNIFSDSDGSYVVMRVEANRPTLKDSDTLEPFKLKDTDQLKYNDGKLEADLEELLNKDLPFHANTNIICNTSRSACGFNCESKPRNDHVNLEDDMRRQKSKYSSKKSKSAGQSMSRSNSSKSYHSHSRSKMQRRNSSTPSKMWSTANYIRLNIKHKWDERLSHKDKTCKEDNVPSYPRDNVNPAKDICHIDVKLADLGNACWRDKHFSRDIQTRQYRSIEVLLRSGYDTSADIWSVACMAFELATGDYLFDPHTQNGWTRNEDHIGIIMRFLEYFDMPSITQHVDLITLHAYDFRTPQRNYEDADYSAPLYFAHGRQEHQNANYMVKWFIDHGAE
ncbi:SRSF protein kinase 1-like, partial [Diaphorina citri]|uniref:non-specific serine/threonine protein kinase n=2 Tax=Diaphorina citri TaxID=121845 RepID=A0A1S3D1R4_DIACI